MTFLQSLLLLEGKFNTIHHISTARLQDKFETHGLFEKNTSGIFLANYLKIYRY